jgi:3-oxoacyl-[acyl-carrier protein] reductase
MGVLDGRVALVTGSSRGIGAAIARRLAADGAKVVLHARSDPALVEAVAADIRAKGGIADVVLGDLGAGDTALQVVKDAFKVHGALDILVCNAGAPHAGPIEQQTAATIDPVLALNLRSVILAVSEYARLTQSEHGRVVLISSASASQPAVRGAVYSGAKAAAAGFIRSVAQELGPRGITCNSVEPGLTLSREAPQEIIDKVSRFTALRRPGMPEDIADVVAFLASDEGRWLTGLTLAANGGAVASASTIIAYA